MNPVTALSDLFNKLITEHGSAGIQTKHIALLREQASILERQLLEAAAKNALLTEENHKLEAENENLKKENASLKIQIYRIKKNEDPPGDKCPYCRMEAGKLIEIKPHTVLGKVGVKVMFYECTNCRKKYDKQHEP